MHLFLAAAAILSMALSLPALGADDPAARKVLQATNDRNASGFQAGQSKTSVTLTLASGKSKTWLTLSRVLRGKDGRLKSRVTFLEPADAVGTELLILEEGGGAASQYLWLPKTGRLRRISGSQRNEAFMGTDFSFGDLQGRGLQTGEAKLAGSEAIGGAPCTRIDVAIVDGQDAYGKVQLWIDERLWLARQINFFDKAGAHVKTLVVDQVQAGEPGRTVMKKFRMINHLRNSVTTVETRDVDQKTPLPESMFVPEALGK
ncbi:MAG: outer membrane lipoprotein-sorting protein [Deltaproteobacteria bacterium]|nr:outer membrane lipoprotein-sorting protein [Deltaproteobacteria bacterium]